MAAKEIYRWPTNGAMHRIVGIASRSQGYIDEIAISKLGEDELGVARWDRLHALAGPGQRTNGHDPATMLIFDALRHAASTPPEVIAKFVMRLLSERTGDEAQAVAVHDAIIRQFGSLP